MGIREIDLSQMEEKSREGGKRREMKKKKMSTCTSPYTECKHYALQICVKKKIQMHEKERK